MLRKINWLLLAILIVAALLRFIGIYPSYPPYHSDEGMSYSQGIFMIIENTLDAHGYPLAYAYPNVVPVINALAFKLIFIPASWINFWVSHMGKVLEGYIHIPLTKQEYKSIYQLEILGEREKNVLTWGRILTAFFGVGVVFLVYKISSWPAAFLAAVNYRQVLNSHLDLPDIYSAFFLLLSIYFSKKIWENPTQKNYLIAGIFAGISFSTKFHIYAIFPLVVAHIFANHVFTKRENIFNLKILISGVAFLLTFMLINPYHLIHIEQTKIILQDVTAKYGSGKMKLDIYPFWYLINIGIGKLVSVTIILGILFSFFKETKMSIFLLSAILPFFFVVTYYTNGGFYTRNFITIMPLLLIFAGTLVMNFSKIIRNKTILNGVIFLFLVLISWDNIQNSIVVAKEYTKQWNYLAVADWASKNIPKASRVAAHSSVLLPEKGIERLQYELADSFSIEEFRDNGADYAISNLDWATGGFYTWMGGDWRNVLTFKKPNSELEKTYPAMALRELSDFSIYSEVNSWQAPDSHFIVSKIPKYIITNKEKKAEWRSTPINVENWNGFYISTEMKTVAPSKDGFLFVNFYPSLEDAKGEKNRIAVRLSRRNKNNNEFEKVDFAGTTPKGSKYMTVGVGLYDQSQSRVNVKEIGIYKANVEMDLNGVKLNPIKLDENVLFPNSHGYL